MALGLLLVAPFLPAQKPAVQNAASTTDVAGASGLPLPSQPARKPVAAAASPHKSRKAKKEKEKELVLPPLPSGPLSQLPMDQIPATPAKVSFEKGLLTISAQNSTLGEILRDVRKLTGAAIEIPQGSGASERVVTHLGPGAPRDVLVGLLNGTSFNYVMLGTSSDPTAVASVILTAKTSGGDGQAVANAPVNTAPGNNGQPMPFNRFQPAAVTAQMGQPGNAQPAAEDENKDDEQENADDNNADDQAQPMQPAQAEAAAQEPAADPNQPNAGPRTPEQIMDMLRRQQQPGAAAPLPTQQPQQ
jgi:hypothetical protein